MRTRDVIRTELRDAEARRDSLLAEVADLQARHELEPDDGLVERIGRVNTGVSRADEAVQGLEAELGRETERARAELLDAVTNGGGRLANGMTVIGTEAGCDHSRGDTASKTTDRSPAGVARSAALQAIERNASELSAEAGDRLVGVVERDRSGIDCDYFRAVSSPDYDSAFAKLIGRPGDARDLMTDRELAAVRDVADATHRRNMSIGDPTAGGYGVPLTLDPSIVLSSDGSLSPLRQVASVISVTTSEWKGVSSEGVVAAFAAEATEVADNSPELAQPAIKCEKAQAFVPFSIELSMDYPSLRQELAKVLQDARDNLEAAKFLTGDGTDEPEGILTGLTGTSIFDTASANALGPDDIYAVQEDLGPRWQPRARWLSSLSTANRVHRFSGPASDEAALFSPDRTLLLGKPWHEVSGLSSLIAGGEKVMIYGDVQSAYKIVDRVGLQVEIVPHLFGASRRPTGERGLYAFWRVGAGVVIPGAARVLRVAST
ncbi:MAG: phage major capsid protein [Gaiella sp.]